MNTLDYRRAMEQLSPDPALEEKIRSRLAQPYRPKLRSRRTAGRVLIAAAAIVCTLAAALAVSPELRAAVLTFFRVEQSEQVPGPAGERPEEPELTQSTIGGQVEAQYIRLPDAGSGFSYGSGVLFQAVRAEDGALLGVNYWAAEGDALVPMETHATAFSTAWDGMDYGGTVYWCEYNGRISCYGNGSGGMAVDWDWAVSPVDGRTDAVLLKVSQGSQMDYRCYPMLLDLESGAVTDLLTGTGWEQAAPLTLAQWNSDLSAAILSSDRMGWFCCDRAGKTTVSLSELTGLTVFSAWFTPDDTMILLTLSDTAEDCYDAWTYDPATGALAHTFSRLHAYRDREDESYGFQFFYGGGRGIYISEDGAVTVLDLESGSVTTVEGLDMRSWVNAAFIASPDGERILFAAYGGADEGLGISALGVMDLEEGKFTLLSREDYEALYEGSMSWFDAQRVAVTAHGKDDYNETCLYLYRFASQGENG